MNTNKPFIPPTPIGVQKAPYPLKKQQTFKPSFKESFNEHLKSAMTSAKTDKLSVSKHAQIRLEQRNIHISTDDWKVIEEKVNEAKKMGVKESLVLLNDAALIVSAKNQTVITAMDRKEASTQIFTNIDGTIIIDY